MLRKDYFAQQTEYINMNKKLIVSRVAESGYFLFLLAIALLAIVNLTTRNFDKSPVKILSVVSGSMTPAIPVGSAIFVRSASMYYVNDVVTYRFDQNYVTHRIVFAGNYYLTKGDANQILDKENVKPSQIIGKVAFSVPYLGYLQESTKSIWGLIGFIYIPTLLIIVVETRAIILEIRRLGSPRIRLTPIIPAVLFAFILSGNSIAYYSAIVPAFSGTITTSSANPSPSSTPSPSGSATPTPSPTSSPSPTASPSPSASASPSASPTASPTGTPTACPSGVIGNCGNGAGSNNTVIVENSSTTIIGQQNNTNVSNTVTVNSNTGGNNTGSNTESNTNVQTGATVLTIEVTNSTNSNTATAE
jgi:signal peptidase I